jgi:hypothetical protein
MLLLGMSRPVLERSATRSKRIPRMDAARITSAIVVLGFADTPAAPAALAVVEDTCPVPGFLVFLSKTELASGWRAAHFSYVMPLALSQTFMS